MIANEEPITLFGTRNDAVHSYAEFAGNVWRVKIGTPRHAPAEVTKKRRFADHNAYAETPPELLGVKEVQYAG